MPKKEENIYSPLVICLNCDLYENIPISKGKRITDEICPNCGCKEEIRLAIHHPDFMRIRTKTYYAQEEL